MDPFVELISNCDEYCTDLGRVEYLLNYHKIIDVEIEGLNSEIQSELQTVDRLQQELKQSDAYLERLLAYEKQLKEEVPEVPEQPQVDLRKSVHQIDAQAWAKCQINVPSLAHYSEYIRQLETEHALTRLDNSRQRTIEQLKKLIRTLEEMNVQAKNVNATLKVYNQQLDRHSGFSERD